MATLFNPLVNLDQIREREVTGLSRPGTVYGRNPFASSSYGTSLADQQIENVFKPALQKIRDDQRRRDNASVYGLDRNPTSFYRPAPYVNGLAPVAGQVPGTAGMTPQGPVESLSLTKDPEVEQGLLSIMSRARGADPGAIRSQPRSGRIDDVIGNELARFRGDATNSQQSLKDFTTEFLADRPEYRALVDQELAAIRSMLAPKSDPAGVAGQLEANLNANNLNRSQVTRRVLDELARAGKGAELRSPGGSNTYLARESAQAVSDALLQDAIARTSAGRQNIVDTAGIQTGVLGRGDEILNAYMRQGLMPIEAQSSLDANQAGVLAQLLGIDQANTYVDRPYDDIGRELEALNAASAIRRGVRFEGVGGGFDTGVPRVNLGSGGGGGGGGFDLESLLAAMNNGGGGGSFSNPLTKANLRTTSGAAAAPSFNPGVSEAALNMDILRNARLNYDMGEGSDASRLRMPGTTTVNSRGERFIVNPSTGRYDFVGADGLTDMQRYYD